MNEHHCCPLEDKKLRWRRITANVAKPKKIEDDHSISLLFAKNRVDLRSSSARAKMIFARYPMKFGAATSRHDPSVVS
jgi:hypothetical protein